jgi:hypothetical protein
LECELWELMVRVDTALDLANRHAEAIDLEKKERDEFVAKKSSAELDDTAVSNTSLLRVARKHR